MVHITPIDHFLFRVYDTFQAQGEERNIHYEFPRLFDRVPFFSCLEGTLEVGYGKHSLSFNRMNRDGGWYIAWK